MRLIPTSITQRTVDPNTGGQTIAALMARQRALQEQQIPVPSQIASPWQGLSLMANNFVNNLQQNRASEQEAAARQRLAQLMGGVDATTGATSEQIGQISSLDPEMATRMMADAMTARRQQAAQDASAALTREGWTHQDQAAEAARTASEALTREGWTHQDQAAQAAAAQPKSTVGQILADFNNGAYGDPLTPEAQQRRDDAITKANTVPAPAGAATDRKALWSSQDEYLNTATTLGQLGRASELLKQGIITGYTAGPRTAAGAAGWTGEDEKQAATRTKEYNSIMNQEAILAMSAILKGATSNTEMAEFIKNMNDPTIESNTKAKMIDRMIAKAQAHQELQAGRIKELGGDTPQMQQAPVATDEAGLLERARKAIADGADAALVRKRLVDKGVDPGKL